MTSKEALNNIKNLFIGGSINLAQQFEIIEKDLEILDILKKHIYSSDSSISIILDDLRCYDDFTKVKEWYENE